MYIYIYIYYEHVKIRTGKCILMMWYPQIAQEIMQEKWWTCVIATSESQPGSPDVFRTTAALWSSLSLARLRQVPAKYAQHLYFMTIIICCVAFFAVYLHMFETSLSEMMNGHASPRCILHKQHLSCNLVTNTTTVHLTPISLHRSPCFRCFGGWHINKAPTTKCEQVT